LANLLRSPLPTRSRSGHDSAERPARREVLCVGTARVEGENDALRLVRPTEASEHNRGAVSNRSHRTSRSFPRGQGVLRRYQWRPLWMPRYDRLERSKPRREPSFEDTVEPGSGGYLGDVGL
jgi:hypothetical protein